MLCFEMMMLFFSTLSLENRDSDQNLLEFRKLCLFADVNVSKNQTHFEKFIRLFNHSTANGFKIGNKRWQTHGVGFLPGKVISTFVFE